MRREQISFIYKCLDAADGCAVPAYLDGVDAGFIKHFANANAFFFINSSVRKVAAVDLLRYRELERKVVGITATMLTKCLRELEQDKFIVRKQYNTIPPTVEYSLAERGKTLIPALESVYQWAEEQMKKSN